MRQRLHFTNFDRPHARILLALMVIGLIAQNGPAGASGDTLTRWFECADKTATTDS